MPGAMARLLSEDWHEMTRAANESLQHVGNLARWIGKAREQDPGLDDGQAAERAAQLKAEFYRELAARGVAARQGRPPGAAVPIARGPVAVRCRACGRSWEVPAKPDGSRPQTARCAQRRGGCGQTVHVPQRATGTAPESTTAA
jgi:hypothetical protein